MNRENVGILLRLLYGAVLVVAYFLRPRLVSDTDFILLILAYLILLQAIRYFAKQRVLRIALLILSFGLCLYLVIPTPALFPFLLFPLLYEVILYEPVIHISLYGFVMILGYWLSGSFRQPSLPLTELLLLLLIAMLLVAIRNLQSTNRKLDQKLLSLEKSMTNMALEQKKTQVHIDQLRELFTLEERNRISRDLHDSIGHSLSTIRIQLEAIAQIAPQDGEKASQMAKKLSGFTEDGLQKLRLVLHQMKPHQYRDQELIMQLIRIAEDFAAMSGIEVRVTSSNFRYTTKPSQDQLLQLALQEFLSNAHRHGHATRVNTHLHYTKSNLTLTMKDNGVGASALRKNIGLTGGEERVRAEHGEVHITTSPGTGFMTQIQLPRGETE